MQYYDCKKGNNRKLPQSKYKKALITEKMRIIKLQINLIQITVLSLTNAKDYLRTKP